MISSNGLKRLEYYQEFEVRKNDVTHTLLSSIYHCYSLPNVRFEVYYNPTVPYRTVPVFMYTFEYRAMYRAMSNDVVFVEGGNIVFTYFAHIVPNFSLSFSLVISRTCTKIHISVTSNTVESTISGE